MTSTRLSPKSMRFAIAGVVAISLLSGCAGGNAPRSASASASQAEMAMAKGKVEQAIPLAEAAVQSSPRDAALRVTLANAYLKAGRFDSAATTYEDAMELGDNSARTALALALSDIAAGRNRDAVALLDDWRESIPASDLGLALALAGETGRGVAILTDALRYGENSAKLRQNLAYAFALDGRWREARLMMQQDVPADQIDDRLSTWATQARPEDHRVRIATLLGAPVRQDSGQPQMLALSNTPSAEQLAAESSMQQPVEQLAAAAAPVEAPVVPAVVVAQAEPASPAPVASAPVATASVASWDSIAADEVAAPVARPSIAVAQPAAPRGSLRTKAPAPARVAVRPATVAKGGSHLVQLGSFSSPQGARRAWGIFTAKNPELKNYRMTITPAVVHGKNFWRVAAGGFNNASAGGLCASVKKRGGACFAYAANRAPATNVPVQLRAAAPLRAAVPLRTAALKVAAR